MRVVLDTSTAGYLLVPHPRAGQEEVAAHVMRMVDDAFHRLIIPTPALTEILGVISRDRRAGAVERLMRIETIEFCAFDEHAARIAADLCIKTGARVPWQHVKVDAMIVACAFKVGAEAVCALDGDHERLAKRGPRGMLVLPPEKFLQQLPLPARVRVEEDTRSGLESK